MLRKRRKPASKPDTQTDPLHGDLPGYYCDPKTHHYLLIPPSWSPQYKYYKEAMRKPKKKETHYPATSFPDLITCREIGVPSRIRFENEFNLTRACNLSMMYHMSEVPADIQSSSYHIVDKCQYMIGIPEKRAIITALTSDKGPAYQLNSIKLDSTEQPPQSWCILNVLSSGKITDMNYGTIATDFCNDVPCVLYSTPKVVCLEPLANLFESQDVNIMRLYDLRKMYEYNRLAVCSCAFHKNNVKVAVGLEHFGKLFQHDYHEQSLKIHTNGEKPFSMVFDSTSNLLFCGTNKGNLLCVDLRNNPHRQISYSIRVGPQVGVSCLHLLTGDSTIIASAYDNHLVKVDLKMRRKVHIYPGHINSHHKLPISVDPTTNILCSMGSDNITRLWKLSDGEPILSLPVNMNMHSESSAFACYSDSWNFNGIEKSSLVITYDDKIEMYTPTKTW